jgi:hypothetical protein
MAELDTPRVLTLLNRILDRNWRVSSATRTIRCSYMATTASPSSPGSASKPLNRSGMPKRRGRW